MAKSRSRDLKAQMARNAFLANPRTPLGLATALRTRGGGIRAGYLNKLNRLQKKCPRQLFGLPGCGSTVRDWMLPYIEDSPNINKA